MNMCMHSLPHVNFVTKECDDCHTIERVRFKSEFKFFKRAKRIE